MGAATGPPNGLFHFKPVSLQSTAGYFSNLTSFYLIGPFLKLCFLGRRTQENPRTGLPSVGKKATPRTPEAPQSQA